MLIVECIAVTMKASHHKAAPQSRPPSSRPSKSKPSTRQKLYPIYSINTLSRSNLNHKHPIPRLHKPPPPLPQIIGNKKHAVFALIHFLLCLAVYILILGLILPDIYLPIETTNVSVRDQFYFKSRVDIANRTKTTPQVKVHIGRWLRDIRLVRREKKKKKQCQKPKNKFVIRDDKVEEYKKYSETRD